MHSIGFDLLICSFMPFYGFCSSGISCIKWADARAPSYSGKLIAYLKVV